MNKKKIFNSRTIILMVIGLGLLLAIIYFALIFLSGGKSSLKIVGLKGSCDKLYTIHDEILQEELYISAVYEDGSESSLTPEDYTILKTKPDYVGEITKVPVLLNSDNSIGCYVDVNVQREKFVSFTCGYPNIESVHAVLYDNGELCFEGTGDILVFNEGEMPWMEYEGMEDMPILSVSFQETVTPVNIDYLCKDIITLEYIHTIPSSVVTMVESFAGCPNVKATGDWQNCKSLININGCYADNESLLYIHPLPENVVSATDTFYNCLSLAYIPDMNYAVSLRECSGMFEKCKKLTAGVIPPNAENLSKMFSDCINLRQTPVIPDTAKNMDRTFQNNSSITKAEKIPEGVENLTNCFYGCGMLEGTLEINCSTDQCAGIFAEACAATKLTITGSCSVKELYAETNNYKNILY